MNKDNLNAVCKQVKKDIIEVIYGSKSGHPGGSLSCSES